MTRGVDWDVGERIPEIDPKDLVRLGEALPGGEIGPIVHDDDAKPHHRAHGAHRLCDMTRPYDHQVRMGVMRLHIHLEGVPGGGFELVNALLRGSAFLESFRSERQGRVVEGRPSPNEPTRCLAPPLA